MTISEQLFEEYLQNRSFTFQKEQGIIVHPDYYLNISGKQVICEVHQMEGKPQPYNTLITSNPFTKLRSAIKSKVKQGKEAQLRKIPYVIVLYNLDPLVMTKNFVIESAMYGDLTFVLPISLEKGKRLPAKQRNVFGGNGIIRHARGINDFGSPNNTRVSAVAILESFNPTQKTLDDEYERQTIGIDDLDQQLELYMKIAKKLRREGKYNDKTLPKIRVFHNFFASTPLSFDIFSGGFDEQYYIDQATGSSKQYQK